MTRVRHLKLQRRGASGFDGETTGNHRPPNDRRGEDHLGVAAAGVALEGAHQRVTVHDPRGGGEQPAHAGDGRFQVVRLGGVHPAQVTDAVLLGLNLVRLEVGNLRLGGGNEELADPAMGNIVVGAVSVERLAAGHAEARLQRPRRVVESGVDHLGVAGAGVHTDGRFGLQHHHFAPGQGQRARHGQADHPRANHHRIERPVIHGGLHGDAVVRDTLTQPIAQPI